MNITCYKSLNTVGGRRIKTNDTNTSPYAVAAEDELIIVDSLTALIVSLPASAMGGRRLWIKNYNVGVVSVTPDGTNAIDGVEAAVTLVQYDSIELIDTALGWMVV